MSYPHVHIENRRLGGVLNALRELGSTTVPASVLIRMVQTQKSIISHLETIQETNNLLIKKYGEVGEDGQERITPEMDGWAQFQEEAGDLNLVEYDCGAPFVIYEREQDGETVVGWTDPVKTSLELTANVIVDAGDIILIDAILDEKSAGQSEGQVVGSITPEGEGQEPEVALVE